MSVTELRPAAEVSDAPVVERIPTAMLPLPRPLRFRAAAVRTAGLLAFAYLFLTLPRTLSFAGPAYAIDFGLIVDASVFPRIPGFFIVVPVYMIAEKASDVILADAR